MGSGKDRVANACTAADTKSTIEASDVNVVAAAVYLDVTSTQKM